MPALDELILSDEQIAKLSPEQLDEYESIVRAELRAREHLRWREDARPEQLAPESDWHTVYFQGGRGSGKSFAAARILRELMTEDPLRESEGPGQFAIVAPVFRDAVDVCVEAPESGLLAAYRTTVAEVAAGQSTHVERWNRTLGEVRLRDGARVFCTGADEGGERIHGRNLRAAWAEEIGLWRNWERTWDEALGFALRKGTARLIATGTPKHHLPARHLIKRLIEDPNVMVRRLRTVDNREHLSEQFLAATVDKWAGTRVGKQELEGELLAELEGAIVRREWIDEARVPRADWDRRDELGSPLYPGLRVAVIGLDPASNVKNGSEQGLCLAGLGHDHNLYVIQSEGLRESPLAYLRRAVDLALEHHGILVVERNHGAAYLKTSIEAVLKERGVRVPYKEVVATHGKRVRFEPVAALMEQRAVHFVGELPELEEELLSFTGAPSDRFDRGDAFTWALTELAGYSREPASAVAGRAVPYTDRAVPNGAVPWSDGEPWIPGTWPREGQPRTLPGERSFDPFEVGWHSP
ncbi:MAG: terminase family protein [Actinomycetota bacterium]